MPERLRRPAAVPLVTFDPHTSIWSFADRLTDDWPRHWTGTRMSLYAVLRIDGVAYRVMGGGEWLARAAEQRGCRVLATSTEYLFRAGPVELALRFVTPLLADDLDLLSRPVTYLCIRARALDAQAHAVAFYLDMTGEIAVNLPHQLVTWQRHDHDGVTALGLRCETQHVLAQAGDHRRIDWGTAFLAGASGQVTACPGDIDICRDAFVATGVPSSRGMKPGPRKADYNSETVLAMTVDLSLTAYGVAAATLLIAYDDEWSIEYFGARLRPWWRRHPEADPLAMLAAALGDQDAVLARASAFDAELTARAEAASGPAYADLLSLAWRHTIAAHKLVAAPDGKPLFLSKENFSNGCIGTVDVIYPSAPLFLAFNPALLRAMIDPYFFYCASPAWPFPFAAHDLGTYPKANGQTYRGFDRDPHQPILETQMPVEECGNLLILTAALVAATGDADYARSNWVLLARWADYLVEAGADPGEQLCTDDFSGVLAHNVNLAVKAAVGIACAAQLAGAFGDSAAAAHYRAVAERFAHELIARARDGEATRLAFDAPGSWSLKYNMVWDRVLGLRLFDETERRREMAFYRGKAALYGVPLDNRAMLTKPEWMLWAASLAEDRSLFDDFVARIIRYANETPNRVPLSDLYLADSGRKIGFQARSVLGGLFIRLLLTP